MHASTSSNLGCTNLMIFTYLLHLEGPGNRMGTQGRQIGFGGTHLLHLENPGDRMGAQDLQIVFFVVDRMHARARDRFFLLCLYSFAQLMQTKHESILQHC